MIKARQFLLPKDGNPPGLIEDACNLMEDRETGLLRCAVADGATESYCSGYWARLLTEAYCQGHFQNGDGRFQNDAFEASLSELQMQWSAHISGKELPWFAEEKARAGAFAAFVGLTISAFPQDDAPRAWSAAALGDSCLFHYRDDKLIDSFPLANFHDFSNSPYLVSSRKESNTNLADHLVLREGVWFPGDHFVLMTDAVSSWLLMREEEAQNPLSEICQLDEDSFSSWIERMRNERMESGRPVLKNDDVTVLHIVLSEDA